MNISSSSFANILPQMASSMKGQDLQLQISVAVLKQLQDQQKQQTQALLNMMGQSFSLDGTGIIINVTA